METKKTYTAPQVELILIDNEIALVLESAPPVGPGEGVLLAPEFKKNDPFNPTMA